MRLKELISQLRELEEDYGDLPVELEVDVVYGGQRTTHKLELLQDIVTVSCENGIVVLASS